MDDVASNTDIFVNTKSKSNPQPEGEAPLAEYSGRDKPWDTHKSEAADIQAIYRRAAEFEQFAPQIAAKYDKYAQRISECGGLLFFGWQDHEETGESTLKLRKARFCRHRQCPVCQWRRSLMWQARFHQALPSILEQHPKSKWIYATFTVRNCEIDQLAETLTWMNKAWRRLIERKQLRPVQGWIRSTEVTRGSDGTAHPHFHVLMMVPPSMIQGVNYIKHSLWVDLWQSCLKVGYRPNVDVRVVKPKADTIEAKQEALKGGVKETLKYSTKPSDMSGDESWFLELTEQCRNKRFIASGGALKNVLKANQESDDDLALANEEAEGEDDKESPRLAFMWRDHERIYRRTPAADVYAE